MDIIQATSSDLVEVLFLLRECVYDLNQRGLKHWNNSFPGSEIIINDLEKGSIYLIKEKGVLKGMMTLTEEEPAEYKTIEWKGDNSKVLFLLRLAIHPKWQNKGLATQLLEFAEKYCLDNGFQSIRMDAFSGDENSVGVFNKTGFDQAGQFHTQFQETPYHCYEKSL